MRRRTGLFIAAFCLGLAVAPAVTPYQLAVAETDAPGTTVSAGDVYLLSETGHVTDDAVVRYWSPDQDEFRTARVANQSSTTAVVTYAGTASTAQSETRRIPVSTITGVGVTVGGTVIQSPIGATLVPLLNDFRPVLLAAFLFVIITIVAAERRRAAGHRRRTTILRIRDIARPLFLITIITLIAIPAMGASSYQVTVVQPDATVETTDAGTQVQTATVRYNQPVWSTLVVEADEGTVREWSLDGRNMTVTVAIPDDAAVQTRLTVYSYPAIVPTAMLQRLHALHPAVAVIGSTTAIIGPVLLLYIILVDGRQPAPRVVANLWEFLSR